MTIENRAFEADTSKILDIVIHSLYSNREIFLRELISNASDALDKRRFLASTNQSMQASQELQIQIKSDKKAKTLTISDNGIGMDSDDLVSSLGTIARSGTKNFIEQLESSKQNDENKLSLIGQFGVGFYAAFMVAETVDVISRKVGSDKACKWHSDGSNGYSLDDAERGEEGTDIILHLKKDAKEFLEEQRISYMVKKYSDHLSAPIYWQDGEASTMLNSASAIWTRPKSEITEEQYNSFYQQASSAYDTPYLTMHNVTEGVTNFTSLLFIPSTRPMDLFNPERKSRLQLYINRVFITDECEELVPNWLRFVRGVVDTPDLDLNVSREMLQQVPAINKIKKTIIRRVLSELKKQAGKKQEEYQKFWLDFGLVIKEGLYEDQDFREKILELCRFYSCRKGDYISLAQYVSEMKEKQEEIYYLSSETVEQAEMSPHIEGFKARDIDVIVLSDPIDEFWLPLVPDFEGKKFKSASRGALDLDKFESENSEKKKADPSKFDLLIARIKTNLGEKISDVRLSSTLTESPVCLVADEGGMDIQMERLMKAHNRDFQGAPRIMEINPDHELVIALNKLADAKSSSKENELVDDAAFLLFDQAQIIEGRMPADLTAFSKRMTRIMSFSLKSDSGQK
ncbi:MAG: molecular chaperone HtpG [Alphaproteobacteria bacterium]|nr:molecular chaperone HtpG [Alphaproteobacteria bacterium]|tara:strand:- start:146 stop:2032 length:1887 start_codon:yes stop_codon:yes gene_type:complete